MSEEHKQLNSNPEILLRKRRNADRTRLEKQALANKKQQLARSKKSAGKNKFIRAETIVATTLATTREKERVKRISKLEHKKSRKETEHIPSDRDFILKITEVEPTEENKDGLIKEKIEYDGKECLLFVIRIRGPVAVKMPRKVFTILKLMRLLELNTGVFVKLTTQVYSLLKLISPYIIIGKPSLASIRSLIQKRSRIMYAREGEEPKETILNDNSMVEEKLGDQGIICIEDIIHELSTLGESFSKCAFFLLPFSLNREVSGFGALSSLKKLKLREKNNKLLENSNSSTAPIVEVDIDAFISRLN
ncbi:Rlp7p SCDLUD_003429 [Saccharomycodes ludwigii]|uniref:Rlp7p n=1 Tax=Saccharomycodes ludwigii TaxID=36035 RepID=UPI001E89C86D|nr:hypothetical protein SCDLUD_003429 [Saccharomycodes ludwigii]KAH3900447.1 hypothetical protein SCDLUD_003429 [Saccharomycodes ludwigii]